MKAGVTTYQRFGSWYYRFWHRASRPSSPYEKGGHKTQRAASDEGWKKRREVEGGKLVSDAPNLADYAERWLTERVQDLEPITLESYRERLEGHVLPELGRLRLPAITPGHVRRFLAGKRKGYAKNGVRLMRAALSSLLSDAVEDELIPANPCLQIRGRSRRGAEQVTAIERQQQIQPMTLAQRETFLATARRRRANPLLFEVLAKTGLRPSEAYALRGEDLDLAGGRVHVERAWVRGRLKATKTAQTRWVDMPDRLTAALRGARAGLLFTAPEGGPLDPSKVGKAFRATVKAAKIGRFRLYDLRHTYACLRLADGAPPTYVAAQLGHATPATTFRHYARWIPSAGRQWVEKDYRRGDGRGKRKGLRLVTR